MKSDRALDAIETASRDEIVALQTERLRWSLQHTYDNVAHIRAKFDAAGVKPADFRELADIAKFPFTTKQDLRDTYPFGMFAVPQEQGGACACLIRHDRQAHRRRLHAKRHRQLGAA